MRESDKQPNIPENISFLQTKIALLEKDIEYINQQAESRNRWLQAIGSTLVVLAVAWIGQTLLNSSLANKANPVGTPTSIGRHK